MRNLLIVLGTVALMMVACNKEAEQDSNNKNALVSLGMLMGGDACLDAPVYIRFNSNNMYQYYCFFESNVWLTDTCQYSVHDSIISITGSKLVNGDFVFKLNVYSGNKITGYYPLEMKSKSCQWFGQWNKITKLPNE